MEDKKVVKYIILTGLLGLFFTVQSVFAYGVDTHAYLTREIINFYGEKFPEGKIPVDLEDYLIDGARREDDAPRWMNHFYDPVKDRGLESDIYGRGYKSKDWADNSDYQNEIIYKISTGIASVLTAVEEQNISAITLETDYTWRRAIRFYVSGEKEKAMFTLGHVLHLIEDTAVPDHTRNDPHPEGSPYEAYARRFSLENYDKGLAGRLKSKEAIKKDVLEKYFDELANYSNSNFYSQNSIGIQSGYKFPVSDYDEMFGSYLYGVKVDKEFGDYKLFVRTSLGALNYVVTNKGSVALTVEGEGKDLVLQDYWTRLSTKAVQYGAGVVDLFFREAENAKNNPDFQKEELSFFDKLYGSVKDFGQSIVEGFGGVARNISSSFQSAASKLGMSSGESVVEEVKLGGNRAKGVESEVFEVGKKDVNFVVGKPGNTKIPPVSSNVDIREPASSTSSVKAEKAQKSLPQPTDSTSTKLVSEDKEVKKEIAKPVSAALEQNTSCSFETVKTPVHGGVLLNEVAWMGTTNNSSDEWIELKNISGSAVDISGWQIVDKGEQIKIVFPGGTKVPAQGYLLLERTDDDSVPNATADLIYSGALSNGDEGLRLFDSKCGLIDEVLADPGWPAGDSANRQTMERNLNDSGWHTSSLVGGTPRRTNSAAAPSGGSPISSPPPAELVSPPVETSSPSRVLISEISAGTDDGADDEFVELYNSTDKQVDLTGWSLKKKSSSGSESNLVSAGKFLGVIAPRSFFLITHKNYMGVITPDLFYSQSSNNLAYSNNSVVLLDVTDAVVDEVSYSEIEKSKSLERMAYKDGCVSAKGSGEFLGNNCDTDNASDFELRDAPKPQNASSFPEPRSAPGSVQNLEISFGSGGAGLNFNWSGSEDYSHVTSTLIYEIKEAGATSSIYAGGDLTFYYPIVEVGKVYKFTVQAFDKEDLGSSWAEKEIYAPSFVKDVAFYKGPDESIYKNKFLVEIFYDSYPFLPNVYPYGDKQYHFAIFYLNSEPEKDEVLNAGNSFLPSKTENILNLEYSTCGYHNLESKQAVLNLEDDILNFSNCIGGWRSERLVFDKIGASSIVVSVEKKKDFSVGDFITAAFYGRYNPAPAETLKLIAVDKVHYNFSESAPVHKNPRMTSDLKIEFDGEPAELVIGWDKAEDEDTKESLLTYEINFSISTEFSADGWQDLGYQRDFRKPVFPEDKFLIGVRARDEFGNYSEVKTGEWPQSLVIF